MNKIRSDTSKAPYLLVLNITLIPIYLINQLLSLLNPLMRDEWEVHCPLRKLPNVPVPLVGHGVEESLPGRYNLKLLSLLVGEVREDH